MHGAKLEGVMKGQGIEAACIKGFDVVQHGMIADQVAGGEPIGGGELKIIEAIDDQIRVNSM